MNTEPIDRGPFWKKPIHAETELSWTTITISVCGQYKVTHQCSKLGLSDRAVAEQIVEGVVKWFAVHRKEKPAFAAVRRRIREIKRGLKKPRISRTKSEMKIVRKKR